MPDKLKALLEAVIARTQQGALTWEETPDSNAFKVLFRHGALVVRKGWTEFEDGEERPCMAVEVLNEQGRTAESQSASPDEPDYADLFELWKLAQSRARRSEQLIDELLHELQ